MTSGWEFWFDPRIGPFTRSRREICLASARTRKSSTTLCTEWVILRQVAVVGLYTKLCRIWRKLLPRIYKKNFDFFFLDYNALYCGTLLPSLWRKLYFRSFKLMSRWKKFHFLYPSFFSYTFSSRPKIFEGEYSDALKKLQCFRTEFVYHDICLIECI